MSDQNKVDKSTTVDERTELPSADVTAAIVAGGDIVGTTADDEVLVEGPNSK
jgi:deoxycytidylate deaminase